VTKVSAYIIAFNEAEKIAEAVDSVAWADEVLVLDSHSSDDTARIAAVHGAEVRQLDFHGFGRLRNDAIAACTHDWVFSLDADERCTPAAQAEIRAVLAAPDADAYYVPRRNWFMGRWIRHGGWYPDYRQPQLFRKDALVFDERDEVHESFRVDGRTGHLQSAIVQIPYRNLEQVIDKMQRYSTLGAAKLARQDRPASIGKALAHGLWAFVRIYVLKLGFLDGRAGFVIALGNFEGTFYRYAKRAAADSNWTQPPKDLP
jgi:glycosyltransferase involved in cell wall biosynthesis